MNPIRQLSAAAAKLKTTRHTVMARVALLISTTLLVLYVMAILVTNVHRGFDITDESYYILSAAYPGSVMGATTHFGFVTGVLYQLSAQNIWLFKLAGIVVLLLAGLSFALALRTYSCRSILTGRKNEPSWSFALVILSGSLFYYGNWWLPTPSYNWLALVSALLAGSGFLWGFAGQDPVPTKHLSTKPQYIGAVLLGAGGALGFMAKPTTALVLLLIAVLWIVVHHKRRQKGAFVMIAAGVSVALLSLHAWMNFGGFSAYHKHIQQGLELGAIMGGGHTLASTFTNARLELHDFVSLLVSLPIFRLVALLSLLIIPLRFTPLSQALVSRLGYILLGIVFFWWAALLSKAYYPGHRLASFADEMPRLYLGTSLLSVLIMLLMVALAIHAAKRASLLETIIPSLRTTAITGTLFALACAYAFGSATEIVRQMSGAAVFLAAAIYYLGCWLAQDRRFQLLPGLLTLAIAITALSSIQAVYEKPYRLRASIDVQKHPVTLLATRGTLQVDKETASYVHELQQAAVDGGWKQKTPMIDMTGGSPGALVILNGKFIGRPWLLGGYPGSNAFAEAALTAASHSTLSEAWILTAPEGRRKLDEEILRNLNLNFPAEYQRVGEMRTGHRNERQLLWKPLPGED